jgi:glycosyltransferase involved in cell wall biosynthesis
VEVDISIIIPTLNRANLLKETLDSIMTQSFPSNRFEVIVIDNGSTDNTKQVVNAFQEKIINLKYIYDDRPGLHIGRNLGALVARAEILVFADDDIEAFPDWLSTIFDCFVDEEVGLVGGNDLPKFEIDPPLWIDKMWRAPSHKALNIIEYLSLLNLGEVAKEINPHLVFGCNFSIRKKIVFEAKGFHPDGMPSHLIRFRGDGESYISEYILSKNYKTIFHPAASVFHKVTKNRMTLEYFKGVAFRAGVSNSYTAIRKNLKGIKFSNSLLKRILKKLFVFLQFTHKDYELKKIELELNNSFERGYLFHQEEVLKDLTLKSWILQSDYFPDSCSIKSN